MKYPEFNIKKWDLLKYKNTNQFQYKILKKRNVSLHLLGSYRRTVQKLCADFKPTEHRLFLRGSSFHGQFSNHAKYLVRRNDHYIVLRMLIIQTANYSNLCNYMYGPY